MKTLKAIALILVLLVTLPVAMFGLGLVLVGIDAPVIEVGKVISGMALLIGPLMVYGNVMAR